MCEVNNFKIDLDGIRDTFKFSETGLTNKQGVKYKLLPYAANEKTLVSEFSGVVGAFSRIICDKEISEKFNVEAFIEEVIEQVADFEGDMSKEYFKDIIKTMFIDNNELVDFDIKTINYIPSTNADTRIATFLYSVLMDKELKKDVKKHYDREVDNVLYRLVLRALPELKDKEFSIGEYNCYLPFIRKLFIKEGNTTTVLHLIGIKIFLIIYWLLEISMIFIWL